MLTFPGHFSKVQNLEISVPGAPFFSTYQLRILKKSAERTRFKTAKNPTSRRPSESTQEALNSLLAMCSSHFEPFSMISATIPKFSQCVFLLALMDKVGSASKALRTHYMHLKQGLGMHLWCVFSLWGGPHPSLWHGRQRANGYVLKGTRILGIQAKNGSEWLGEWLRRLFGGS